MQNHAGTGVIYFDFKKAFDTVSHPVWLTKLNAYGISGLLLDWRLFVWWITVDFFTSCQSDLIPVISRVPQGSVLGPTSSLHFLCRSVSHEISKSLNVSKHRVGNSIQFVPKFRNSGKSD
jgi:hypothetical protein